MQANLNKDIEYFVVSGADSWEYEGAVKFINSMVGSKIAMHIGHKNGCCMCHDQRRIINPSSFKIMLYPCVYAQGVVESVEEVEAIKPYEGSVDFTIGSQNRSNKSKKSIIVGLRPNFPLKEILEYTLEERYQKSVDTQLVETKVGDMTKLLGICLPSLMNDVFFIKRLGELPFYATQRDVAVIFEDSNMSSNFVGDEAENRFSDYSVNSYYKYHTLLCI